MYKEYQNATGYSAKWVKMPDEYAMCFKVNSEDYLTPLPPYMTLFDSIINLEDLKEITAVADAQQIYKLICFKMPLIDGSKQVDDFAVDADTCIEYFLKVKDVLPDYTDAILSPMEADTITFDDDQATDVNKIENSSKNIYKASGHSILADQDGTTAVTASLIADGKYAMGTLLPQTEGWINRMLSMNVTNPSRVRLLEVTEYTKENYKASLIKDMNYGLPMIMTLGSLNGFSESEIIGLATINRALGIDELLKPMATASTQSPDNTGGRPKNETPTDESEESEDKRESAG
jgi:hypothetical protein